MWSWWRPGELATTGRAGDHRSSWRPPVELSSLRPYMYAREGISEGPMIIFCGPPSETTPACRLRRTDVVSIEFDDLVDIEALILLQH